MSKWRVSHRTPGWTVPNAAHTPNRLRRLIDGAAGYGILETDTRGLVTLWSQGAEHLFGWTEHDMLGQAADRIFLPEDRDARTAEADMRQAAEHTHFCAERWHQRRDGSLLWASGDIMPLRGPDGAIDGYIKIIRDHTAQRHAADQARADTSALREAQSLNTLILNSSQDCIVVLDLEGRTQFVSPGGIAAMEIEDVRTILGLSWLRVWQGAEQDAARAAVAAARAGGTGRFQGFCPTHRGTPKWWDIVVSPLPGPDGAPERLVSIGRDITDRVLAERDLRESEIRFRLIANSAPVPIWVTRLDRKRAFVNRAYADFLNVPFADALEFDWRTILHPDDLPRVYAEQAQKEASLKPFTLEARYRGPHGDWRWIRSESQPRFGPDGALRGFIGVAHDITAAKQAEADMLALNATLEARVEARTRERDRAWKYSSDLQVVVAQDGTIQAANEAWFTLLGHPPDQVVGRNHLEFNDPDFHAPNQATLTTALHGDAPAYEAKLLHADGSARWIAWVAAPSDGLVYASGRNITAERAAAAALDAAQEQLRQAQKMEAVGQLTGGLAHDFNNLLTGVCGSLELLQTRVAQGRIGELDRYIKAAQGAATRAAALTHRLLAFSRRQTLDPRPIDVNRLVAGMADLVQRTVGPAIAMEVVGASDAWHVMADPNQLENVLLNLCINARDAMPDGGGLTIQTANAWLDEPDARSRELPPGPYLTLSVSDTGTGMTAETMRRAFDPFFTTKPIGAGTGLGLSMTYGFVRQSGGQVRIYSEPGQGAMVRLYLPRHAGDAAAAEAPPDPAATPRAETGETILIVDDEATIRMLAVEMLQGLGYATIEAPDGAAGLVLLQSGARVDLLVTDVGLPGGMNGRQLADAARVSRPALRVLFITGYAEHAVLSHGHLAPGMHVMTKPFAMEALATRIRALL
jgi:PAS domain S-box-containing protein